MCEWPRVKGEDDKDAREAEIPGRSMFMWNEVFCKVKGEGDGVRRVCYHDGDVERWKGMVFLSFGCPTRAHDVIFWIKAWAKSSMHPSCNSQEATSDRCEEEGARSLLNIITNRQTVSVLRFAWGLEVKVGRNKIKVFQIIQFYLEYVKSCSLLASSCEHEHAQCVEKESRLLRQSSMNWGPLMYRT